MVDLKDLRVLTPLGRNLYGIEPSDLKSVSVSDLVAVLEAEGGEIHEVNCGREDCHCMGEYEIEAWFPQGRYLVFRVPDGKETK